MLDDILLGNYKLAAANLGLTIEGRIRDMNVRIVGRVDGVPVHLWFGPHATHVTAKFAAPLGAPFTLVTTSWLGRLAHLFGKAHAPLGDAALDAQFSLRAGDPAQVLALLPADARRVLVEIAKEGLHPAVTETEVHLSQFSNGGVDSVDKIERGVRETARLALALGKPA